jgi:EAL domain-containing protein (putative c-di-GMP-specific phosphodiesterase class I)/CheY-like chemotaxis protein
MRPTLLIIEDDANVQALLREVAESCGFDTRTLDSVAAFRALESPPSDHLVLLDLLLRDGDAIEILQSLGTCEVVLISGVDRRVLHAANRYGHEVGRRMVGVLAKPIAVHELRAILYAALDRAVCPCQLDRALDQGQIVVHYEPVFRSDEHDGWKMTAVEAAPWWRHATQGLLPPSAFLDGIEDHGTLAAITERVVQATATAVAGWRTHGLELRASVGLDASLLIDTTWPDRIAAIWSAADLSTESLTLEISERGDLPDVTVAREALARFRLKGFGLKIAQFGTGRASLTQLYRLPFSGLKIDRSFVADVEHSDDARAIVRCVSELGARLRLNVRAEGIDSLDMLKHVHAVGCREAQGALFSPPVCADELLLVPRSRYWRTESERIDA